MQIGLIKSDPTTELVAGCGGIDTQILLKTFSVRSYLNQYIFHRKPLQMTTSDVQELFPLICKSEILALNNTVRGMAKVCAADDLEFPFFGENAQMDYLDDRSSTQFQNPYHDQIGFFTNDFQSTHNNAYMDTHDHSSHAPGFYNGYSYSSAIEEQSLSNLYSSNDSQSLMGALQHPVMGRESNIKQQLPYVQIQTQAFPKMLYDEYSVEHYFGTNNNTNNNTSNVNNLDRVNTTAQSSQQAFFTDMKHVSISDSFSCGSSVESFDSPLDEIFVKTSYGNSSVQPSMGSDMLARKRKLVESPDFTTGSSEVDLPCSFKMETSKKMKRERGFSTNTSIASLDMEASVSGASIPKHSGVKVKRESEGSRFVCNHCDAEFRVRSYLTRHLRKHNNAMAFVCPFYQDIEVDDDHLFLCGGKTGAKCHPTGGFSRKDTFKTHLKALHFIYPPRTRSRERSTLGGRCAGCFEYFDTNVAWFKEHIEPKVCPGFVNKRAAASSIKQEMD